MVHQVLAKNIRQKIWKFCFVKKIQQILKKWPGSGSIFSSADPGSRSGSGSASKLNGS